MSTADLMGGYDAYTTPNAAIAELASIGIDGAPAELEFASIPTIIVTPGTFSIIG
ncbi:hypothetical protein [Kitasatospora sp. NPDC056731]|uniref:hypothetical protein n=1 Tax=Kitasatospora sp. NPDC056731 TaxID=3155422 RepID=UPI003415DD27